MVPSDDTPPPEDRSTDPGRAVGRDRLATFLGTLTLLAAAVTAATVASGVDLLTTAPVYMATPAVAGLATCRRHDVALSTVGLRIGRPAWLALGALAALPVVVLALGLSVGLPGVTFGAGADPLPGVALPSGVAGAAAALGVTLALGVTVNALFGVGEEFGWRGYLLWELAPLGFWRASAAVGAAWGLWHAPAIVLAGHNYPSFPVVGVAAMTAFCVAASPLYTYVVLRGGSVLPAALLHGVFNASAGLVTAYAVADGAAITELVASPVGLAGIAAAGLAAAAIRVAGAPALTREFAAADGRRSDDGGAPAASA